MWWRERPWGGRITWGNRTVRSLGSPFVSSHSLPSSSLGPYVPSAEPVTSGVSEETSERREWPVNDEDERLDQDMRKDDEEPRAAREWGSRSISPVNRSSHSLHTPRSRLSLLTSFSRFAWRVEGTEGNRNEKTRGGWMACDRRGAGPISLRSSRSPHVSLPSVTSREAPTAWTERGT